MAASVTARPYCVMFDPTIPREQPALADWLVTTGAFMSSWHKVPEASRLGIRFVGCHTRAVYTRLACERADLLTPEELANAREWGDWAALRPRLWEGPFRRPGEPPRDALYAGDRRTWPFRIAAAIIEVYGSFPPGIFLDADVPGWEGPLADASRLFRDRGCRVYLNGGRFREADFDWLLRFDGLFYEAVLVGTPHEAESRKNAEALLMRFAGRHDYWVGIQVRYPSRPGGSQLDADARWFLRARHSRSQTVTMRVQPAGGEGAYDLPCPQALRQAIQVDASPFGGKEPRGEPQPP